MEAAQAEPAIETAPELPDGEYAIVELMGHTTIVGRCAEIERFGTKLLAIEPIWEGGLLPTTFRGGSSIYAFTPCSKEVAQKRAATRLHQLPAAVAAAMPPLLLTQAQSAQEARDARAWCVPDDDDGPY